MMLAMMAMKRKEQEQEVVKQLMKEEWRKKKYKEVTQ